MQFRDRTRTMWKIVPHDIVVFLGGREGRGGEEGVISSKSNFEDEERSDEQSDLWLSLFFFLFLSFLFLTSLR